MRYAIDGVVLMIVGLGLIVSRRWLARHMIEAQNWAFGFRFGEKTIHLNEWLAVPFGLVLLILGCLTLFNVIKW